LSTTLGFNLIMHFYKHFSEKYNYSTGAKFTFSSMTIIAAIAVILYIIFFEESMV